MEITKETTYKGTRILIGDEKRDIVNSMIETLRIKGFIEIQMPIIQYSDTFKNKVGEENNNMMYNFTDRGYRELCLAPEYTAVVQKLSNTYFKNDKDVKLFYVQECFRVEKPQAGRYRQFTQLGVEILNPCDYNASLQEVQKIASILVNKITLDKTLNTNIKRGLDYYKEGVGFEISCDKLGSSKQVCGGGIYDGGVGFAIGIDRLLNLYNN